MTNNEEVDRLEKLWHRGQAAGLPEGTPEDRSLFRSLTRKLARAYARVVVGRVQPTKEDKP